MNFYIGKSIKEVDLNSYNVEFSDELLEYIYKNRHVLNLEANVLDQIDPYDDILLVKEQIISIKEICNKFSNSYILQVYEDFDEGKDSLVDLERLCDEAIKKDLLLISIGD